MSLGPPPALSVVVPAYDEAAHVRGHLARIARAVEALGRPFEILLVDDGSRDGTAAEAEAAAREDPRVRVLRHPENRGKGAALATGASEARGDVLAFLDADLEIAPEEIGPLLDRMERAGAGVAVGSKYAEGAVVRRPPHRVLLSRLYLGVTSILFRLPIRDTQTGLKLVRRELARVVVPAIVTSRWAWDVELLLLAHRLGAGIVAGPVAIDFRERGARIGARGFLDSGLDTVRTFMRDRGLAAYGPALARARGGRGRRGRATRAVLAGDDLGLCASVDRGLVDALVAGRLCAVSVLVDGATAPAGAADLLRRARAADVGVHVDLAPDGLLRFLLRAVLGLVPAREVRTAVATQVARARALGLAPTHLDAHRHGFLWPSVYAACAAEARAQGLVGIRQPTPVGALRCGAGAPGIVKGVVLALTGIARRGVPAARGLASPAGIVDAATIARAAARGRLPSGLRGTTFEVVAHPAGGPGDVPPAERGIDRFADAQALVRVAASLARLGVGLVDFRGVRGRRPATRGLGILAPSELPWTSPASSPSSPRS